MTGIDKSALRVAYALKKSGKRGATYSGLKELLRLRDDSSVRRAVRAARRAGLVNVIPTGVGQGAKSVIYLNDEKVPCPMCGYLPRLGHAADCPSVLG